MSVFQEEDSLYGIRISYQGDKVCYTPLMDVFKVLRK